MKIIATRFVCLFSFMAVTVLSCSKKENITSVKTSTTSEALTELEEMKMDYQRALISNPNIFQNQTSAGISLMTVTLPASVDLTSYFPDVADQDQDHIGSCVSYACSYIKGFQENYERHLSGPDRMYTMSAIHLFARVMGNSTACIFGGSSFTNNLNQLVDPGICLEEDLPYDANKCISKTDSRIGLYKWASARFRIKSWRALSTSAATLKAELAKNNPVLLGINVDRRFRYYAGDNSVYNYNYNSSQLIFGHGITCIGYDNEKQAFKLINSYGTGWGDGGYLWISETALRSYVYAAYALDDAIDTAAGSMISPVREIATNSSTIYRLSDHLSNGTSSGTVVFKAFDGKNGNPDYTPIYAGYISNIPTNFTKNVLTTGGAKMFYTKNSIQPGDSPLLKKLYFLKKNTNGQPKLSDQSEIQGYTLKEDLGYVIF